MATETSVGGCNDRRSITMGREAALSVRLAQSQCEVTCKSCNRIFPAELSKAPCCLKVGQATGPIQ
jgi:hypothetical protein